MEQKLTLLQCVDSLADGKQNVVLCPTEAVFWLIGYRPQVSLAQAYALVERAGIAKHRAYIQRGDPRSPDGIYAEAPDQTGWCLFRILTQSAGGS